MDSFPVQSQGRVDAHCSVSRSGHVNDASETVVLERGNAGARSSWSCGLPLLSSSPNLMLHGRNHKLWDMPHLTGSCHLKNIRISPRLCVTDSRISPNSPKRPPCDIVNRGREDEECVLFVQVGHGCLYVPTLLAVRR